VLAIVRDVMGRVGNEIAMPAFRGLSGEIEEARKVHIRPELVSLANISNPLLERYLTSRAIPVELARVYWKEAVYATQGQEYRALAFANDAGGFELRSPSFKGTYGTKAITFLPGTAASKNAAVFEGVFDFVSALAHHGKEQAVDPVLILNSA
jgi:hypothetical protein